MALAHLNVHALLRVARAPQDEQAAPPREQGAGEQPRERHDELIVTDESIGRLMGRIKHNPSLDNAFCVCSRHRDCVKSRTLNTVASKPGSGAVLGYLGAWCMSEHPTKEEHMAFFPQDVLLRRAARRTLRMQPNYAFFRALERHPRQDDSEPERIPRR